MHFLALLLFAAPNSDLRAHPRLGVLGMTAPNVADDLVAAVEETLSTEASAVSNFDVVTTADLKAVVSLAERQQVLGCSDSKCFSHAAELVQLQQLVTGTIQKLPNNYVLSLQRIDLVNKTVLRRVSLTSKTDTPDLLSTAKQAMDALFDVVGRVRLRNQPERAEVFLDGRLLGPTPMDVVVVKTPGLHTLAVTGAGITSWEKTLEIKPGVDLRLGAENFLLTDLRRAAETRRAAGWSLVGTGVLGLGVGGALLGLASMNDQRLDRLDLRVTRQSEVDAITGTTVSLLVGSIVGLVVGGIASGTGIFFLAHHPEQDRLDAELQR
jgi:hypothetical protein